MLALVESTGNHPALADKRERDLPNGVPSNSPPPHSAIANGAHQDWDKHDKSETSAAEFIKTETELRSASPEGTEAAETRTTESPLSAAAAVVEDEEEAELLAAEAQAAAQLEEEEAAADNGLKAEMEEDEAQMESETQLESVLEEELEEKAAPVSPSIKGAETAPKTSAASPEAATASADRPAEDAAEDAAAEEPMQTEEDPSKTGEPQESAKRPRSDAEAEKSSESDKTEELPRKKLRRGSDQSALDLSAPSKDSAETEKRPSLLLSKLQEKQESSRPRRVSARADSDDNDNRPEKIFRNESERAQVLREMRDRVLSSYKAERAPQVQPPNAEFASLERERLVAEAVEAAACSGKLADLERAAQKLQNEIKKLTAEARGKELEWNQLIRKRKLKEEVFLRIHRRKQVLMISEGAHVPERKFDSDGSECSDVDGREAVDHTSSGEELLSAALRLGSRNFDEYAHSGRPVSPGTGAASVPPMGGLGSSRPKSGSNRPLSLLKSQLSKPQDPQAHRPQLLLQQLQRQQRNFLMNNVNPPACRLSPSVSLSAIPTTTAPSSLPNSQSGVKCFLSGQGTLLGVDKSGPGPLNPSSGIASTPAPIRTRPILPKPVSTSGGSVVSMSGGASESALSVSALSASALSASALSASALSASALSASALSAAAAAALGVGAFSDGGGVIGEGRQGPIVDVQSIIADYRSKHPEGVPRRGRRLKPKSACSEALVTNNTRTGNGGSLLSMSLPTLGCGGHVRTGSLTAIPTAMDLSELGLMLNPGGDSPSSTESSLSGAAPQEAKDVLMQFAKLMSQAHAAASSNPGPPDALVRPPPPPYPEVTLHPVLASSQAVVSSAATTPTTSLLHGILTKPTSSGSAAPANPAKPTTFSPTLARLLTAPERSSHASSAHTFAATHLGVTTTNAGVSLNDLLATAATKARSELTITPVGATATKSHKSSQGVPNKSKSEVVLLDDDEIGAVPVNGDDGEGDDDQRLVIDESAGVESPSKESVPACQSCHTREAEFVCAGCSNQWYCSRDCQIAAWDQHSEVCSL